MHVVLNVWKAVVGGSENNVYLVMQYAQAYQGRGVIYELIGETKEAERGFAIAKELGVEGP